MHHIQFMKFVEFNSIVFSSLNLYFRHSLQTQTKTHFEEKQRNQKQKIISKSPKGNNLILYLNFWRLLNIKVGFIGFIPFLKRLSENMKKNHLKF